MSGAIQYLLNNQSFNDFDRLHFLREFINPLYSGILKLRLQLEYPFETKRPTARNPMSKSIFSADFLNPYFYAELTEDEDNADHSSHRQKTLLRSANKP